MNLSKHQKAILREMKRGMRVYQHHGINSWIGTSQAWMKVSFPTLHKLIDLKMIEKIKSDSDWRATYYKLTELGKQNALTD